MRKVSEVRLDEDNFVYTVSDDSGIKVTRTNTEKVTINIFI